MNVKWIKIVTDIFDDEKILLIESMPDGDTIIVCWFKLLCLAGKQNNRGVFILNDRIAYTEEMLSTIFRRPITTVRLALQTFEQFGMIERIEGVITIPNWEKHQSIDGMEKIREQTRKRVEKHRAQQKCLLTEECNVTCNATVTDGNATDIDIEEDIDIDNIKRKKYIKKEKEPFHPPTLKDVEEYCQSRNNGIDAQHFIDYYTARGWMVGKNKMKDWKAAVRTWESRNKEKPDEHKWNIKYDNE